MQSPGFICSISFERPNVCRFSGGIGIPLIIGPGMFVAPVWVAYAVHGCSDS